MIKKATALLLAGAMALMLFTACGDSGKEPSEPSGEEKLLQVVTTTFPQYDWTREIIGESDSVELTLLLDNAVDMHSYQPTVEDMVKISTCDLFIYTGGESDSWVADALASTQNPDMVVINLMEVLGEGVKSEELVEGMEHDHDDHEQEEGPEQDEHVWLSLRNAQGFCECIAEALARINPENAAVYQSNAAAYTGELAALDDRYRQAVDTGAYSTLIFADRFPFRYMVDDYGLDYYAAFAGCSAETEASFETVIFLAEKTRELGLPCVLIIETSDGAIAQTVIENADDPARQILTLNSMQGAGGATYLAAMEENLEVLKQALDCPA